MVAAFHNSGVLENTGAGVYRSRVSFQLNTRRRRRWLLVQLVSMEVGVEQEQRDLDRSALAVHAPATYISLLSGYELDRFRLRS